MSVKRLPAILMLLVLVASTLSACGSPATTTSTQSTTAAAPTEAAPAPTEAAAAPTEAPAVPTEAPATEAPPTEAATTAAATEAAPTEAAATEAATEATGSSAGALPNVSSLNLPMIKIASQSPLSGPQSALGTGIRNGVELAVEQLAPKMGLKIQLDTKDDQATPDVGAANANALAADPDVLCVAGHLNSGVALAALPTYKSATLTMVSPANTNIKITDEFGGIAYRVVGRDDVQGTAGGKYAAAQGYKTAYVLNDKTDYGLGLAEFFRQEAEKDGIQVLGFEGTEEKSVFDSILNPILAAQPDVVFWGGIYSEGGPLLKQMRDKGITAAFMGGDGLDSSDLAKLAGDAVIGVQYTTIAGPPREYPAAAQMAKDYQAKFGSEAPAFSPQAYDAAGVCLAAIAKAAEKAGGKPTRQQVNDAMKDLGTYPGVSGDIKFDAKGDRNPATYFILKVTSSDPEKFSSTEEIASKQDIEPPSK